MSSLLKNLLTAFCITLLLGVAYYFFNSSGDESMVDESFGLNSEIALKTEKLLADTQKINNYALDISIFDDPRFISFIDFTVEIQDVATGRSNPFEPVE